MQLRIKRPGVLSPIETLEVSVAVVFNEHGDPITLIEDIGNADTIMLTTPEHAGTFKERLRLTGIVPEPVPETKEVNL